MPFANPLGVAAGLDKDGEATAGLFALGFAHVEVGTVTFRPQPGNDRPRVWRVIDHAAVINAMGFPSRGSADVRQRLLRASPAGVLGINIGKNRDTPIEQAADDYAALVAALFDVAHYFTINVSSPNTPGLRSLQHAGELSALVRQVVSANKQAAALAERDPKPILVKISPDMTDDEIAATAEAAVAGGVSGIVATNTTTSRAGLAETFASLPGGLSGAPLRAQANHVVRVLYRTLGNRIPIIGVGGISSGVDALERIRSGATLLQLYTAFTYQGPGLAGQILRDLSADADRNGWLSLNEIIGSEAR
ncbi:MAG: quinone-dependent dihydroorotate dehydrogenase [Chloroflexi bacterium]|nr:MAG: quinone-dependent dihydroorotate dehydrogenase [Chloroflexota bacterium]